jgi:DNA-binding NarL/FixJ family response regulator
VNFLDTRDTFRPIPSPPAMPWASWQSDIGPAEAWRALLRGGWTVAEHVLGHPSRRLAVRWAPGLRAGETLCAREIQLAFARAQGASLKELAFDLGRSCPVVSHCLATVRQKLKVRSEADLVALFGGGSPAACAPLDPPAPPGLRASRVRDACAIYLVLTYPAPSWSPPPCLSEAERGIVAHLVAGLSHQEIARARGCAARTVANHVASIHRKLKVHSRLELALALSRRDPS